MAFRLGEDFILIYAKSPSRGVAEDKTPLLLGWLISGNGVGAPDAILVMMNIHRKPVSFVLRRKAGFVTPSKYWVKIAEKVTLGTCTNKIIGENKASENLRAHKCKN